MKKSIDFSEYVDKELSKIISLIKISELDLSKFENKPRFNLVGVNQSIDITNEIINVPLVHTISNYDGTTLGYVQEFGNKSYSIENDSFYLLDRLVKNVYEKIIKKYHVSFSFVNNLIVDRIYECFRNNASIKDFMMFLDQSIKASIKQYQVYIPVLYLDITTNFKIGIVQFMRFTESYLDKLETEFNKNNPNNVGAYKFLKEDLLGNVFAVVGVTAELDQAKELAFRMCSFAVDIVRICSPIIAYPLMKSDFDLERKTRVVAGSNIYLQRKEIEYAFTSCISRNANSFLIDEVELMNFAKTGFAGYHKFFLKYNKYNELERLIHNSIISFAESLKESNLHKRISNIFTIYESLLVNTTNAGIQDSLIKYAPKLIFNNYNERKEFAKILRSLYSVRSSFVHHANCKEFNPSHLSRLQIALSRLLLNLIDLSHNYKSKQSLLERIDMEIEQSFDLKMELNNISTDKIN